MEAYSAPPLDERRAPCTDGPLTHFASPPGEKSGLVFTRAQVKWIRAHVLERIRAEEVHQRARLDPVLSSVQADPGPEVKALGNNFAEGNGEFSAAAYGS